MVPLFTARFWTAEDETGAMAPYLACRARDIDACASADALAQAFGGLHEGAGLFYFVETDGGFRVAPARSGATCTLELRDGTPLMRFVVPPDWATLAVDAGGVMMVIVQGEAEPARFETLSFARLATEVDVEILSFCATAAG